MGFVDFLRATVMLSGGSATALAAATVVGVTQRGQPTVALFALGWWALAAVIGIVLGRRNETNSPIAQLLAGARAVTTLPEQRPGRVLLNRLWPLLVSTLGAVGAGFVFPQVPAVGAGFAIIWALAWRHQHSAVEAIERRDGARFHVEKTSPMSAITLTRTPGFKAYLAHQHEQAA